MEYVTVIGLEVHSQLKTNAKMFCGCKNSFGESPNTMICPVCLGLPGALPSLNKKVIEYAVMAGSALNCTIAKESKMDRKNYFYPDIPKAFQISQFDQPLCEGGHLMIETPNGQKRLGITRIHIEEDAGKLIHMEGSDQSVVDYNRSGIPLIEIVSEPDMRSADEAYAYLTNLKAILEYIEVSDCNMQEGSLRCDANISIMPKGSSTFGTKTEIKNMNSFKGIHKAITYEVARQKKVLESGKTVSQETRLWDANQEKTFLMRSKEDAHDYRYFPEPDLPVIDFITSSYVEKIKNDLPELPKDRRKRFVEKHGLPEYDANVLTSQKVLADYFEQCLEKYPEPKLVSNWVMGSLLKELNDNHLTADQSKVSPEALVELIKYVQNQTISHQNAKVVFETMFKEGKDAEQVIEEKGLKQISDTGELETVIQEILSQNAKSVESFKSGNQKAIGFLLGQVMYKTKGKANPKVVREILLKHLS
ncbi:aspartyl/glutamyl-tRNA amidotransferase subunit B [PVC group bacterium (ex Bugula neritina AB1)]|nr:aspartyl/glutamyl-tRNA amidotransferase subunit B [PVC group bacterium (ex Bugula neritina AB1)]